MEIYWIENKERRGPASVPDVLSMIEAGELTWESRGWHRGCTGWQPLGELPALSYYAHRAPLHRAVDVGGGGSDDESPTAAAAGFDPHPETPEAGGGQQPTPALEPGRAAPAQIVAMPSASLRFLARMVDLFLYMLLAFALLRLFGAGFHAVYYTPLFWVPMVLLEGWIIARFGTTPGKKLLGFRVTTFDNRPLSVKQGVLRSGLVFLLGLGLMYFPILPLAMMGMSWYQVRSRGLASWDARLHTLPRMAVDYVRPERIVAALFLLFICLQLTGWVLMGWSAEIQAYMHETMQSAPPEMHRFIDSLFP